MYTALSAVCIAVLLAIVTVCVVIFCRNRRTPWKNIEFIRRFKKGNCAVVYLAAIPLYWIGLFYQDPANWVMAIFTAISKAVTLVVLRYDTKDIEGLMRDNPVYRAAMYLCFVVVAVNAMLFVASLMYQKVWEWWQIRRWNRCKKERLLIVGLNEANLSIYESEKHRRVMLLDDISDGEKAALFAKRINFISGSATEKSGSRRGAEPVSETRLQAYCCDLLRDTLSDPESRRSCVLIINTQSDEANIDLCHRLIACSRRFLEGKDPKTVAHLLSRARVYVFGSPDHETVYDSIVEASDGCIHYVSKYRRIAMDFIDRYPLTQFMTEEQIDYGTSLLREGVDVNVAMIGFGKTNRRIFLTSVANNQFMTEENGTPVLKSVRYHIFDKQNAENDKNLNHSYRRFQNEFEDRIAEQGRGGEDQPYLPFPMPASVTSTPGVLDVNSPAFYRSIRAALSGEKSFNYIIIAFGTDLENQDMAQKLLAKKQEWGLRNTYVFVKVRSGNDAYEIFRRDDCFLIGDERKTVYNVDRIVNHTATAMAKMRDRIYALEKAIKSNTGKGTGVSVSDVYAQADRDWYLEKTPRERESNVYACLSLRAKLHLMGLDYLPACDTGGYEVLDRKAYLDRYAPDDLPISDGRDAEGKPIIRYGLDFKESRRRTMAIHEHYRWNSFMLSVGFVPASKAEILADREDNGKDYTLRRHGNLTTFDGLVEFRKLIARRDGLDELQTDVIKYDYQLMDDAYWLLTENQFRIVSRGR